jgi:hypothetical protein
VIARLSAKTVTSPVDAGSIATAATPAGTLPARNSSRCGAASSPKRLYSTAKPIQVHHSVTNRPSATHTLRISGSPTIRCDS